MRPSSRPLPLVPLQAKLEVGSADDPLEHEAERVAHHALHAARRCACGGTAGPGGECAACRAKRLAHAITPAAPQLRTAPRSVTAVLSSPGRPLEPGTRAFFESRLGADLGPVRIHKDAGAAASARDVGAEAYTVGRDVVFGAGRYQPSSEAGRALLAHELVHVVQQGTGRTAPSIQRKARTYTIHPDHAPMGPDEVLILMAMKIRGVDRAEAIRLIAKGDEIACGEHPACTYGVKDTKPITFTVGASPEPKRSAPAKKPPVKPAAPSPVEEDPTTIGVEPARPSDLPAEIQSAIDDPFVKRLFSIGTHGRFLQLPAGQPSPDDYAAVNYIRDTVMRLSENELTCYRDYVATRVSEGQQFGADPTLRTWRDLARSLYEFSSLKADLCFTGDEPSSAPRERLRSAAGFYELQKKREALEKAIKDLPHITGSPPASVLPQQTEADRANEARYRELGQQLTEVTKEQARVFPQTGFASVAEFDRAANDFRLYFRDAARKVAERMLFESSRVLADAVRRYQIRGDKVPKDCEALYDALYRTYPPPSFDYLKDAHPILRNPKALEAVAPAHGLWEFSWRLTGFAIERLTHLDFVQKNLDREKDVVFSWPTVVDATFHELGLEQDSIYGWIIREQRGKPGTPLWEKLIDWGIDVLLFALSFVELPVALTVAVVKASRDTAVAGAKYTEEMYEAEAGFREPPSIVPVILPPIVELAPFLLHGVFSRLRKLLPPGGVPRPADVNLEPTLSEPASDSPLADQPSSAAPAPGAEPAGPEPIQPSPAPTAAPTAPVPQPVDPRIVRAIKRLANARNAADKASGRLQRATLKATEAERAKELAELELAQARTEAGAARAERDRAREAYRKAQPGAKQAPRKEFTKSKEALDKLEGKVKRAENKVEAAKGALDDAKEAVQEQATSSAELEAKAERAQERLAATERAVAEGTPDRLRPGDIFSRSKRRPNFGRDGPRGRVTRGVAGELEHGAEVRVFKDPFKTAEQQAELRRILKLAETNPQQAGNEFAKLTGRIEGWGDISESFRAVHGSIGRRWDFGNVKELTIEGRAGALGESKLDQLWFDLNEHGSIDLTVPMLSDEAADQLARLAGEWRSWTGRDPLILVRETAW